MTDRVRSTNEPPDGRTAVVSRTWRMSNVPLPEAHIGLMTVGVVAHLLRPWPITSRRSTRRVGWPLIGAGVALGAWTIREVGDIDVRWPDHVVATGPYAVSRNPMYVAWTLAFVGVALVVNTAWLVMLMPPLAGLTHREVRTEERRLAAVFGLDYEAYRARVRRYV